MVVAALFAAAVAEPLLQGEGPHHDRWTALTVAITATLIALASRRNTLAAWLGDPVSQYFGRISYSLYLIHVPAMTCVVWLVAARLPDAEGPWALAFLWLIGFATAVGSAELLYRLVEKPFVGVSARLKRKPRPDQTASASTTSAEPSVSSAKP